MSTHQVAPPMARTTRPRRRAPRLQGMALPPELVVEVLEYLSTEELWTAARVSRQFYAAVWRAGLVINRKIDWCLDTSTISGVDGFKDLVHHALPKDLRIGLSLECLFHDESEPPSAGFYYKAIQPQLDEIFGIITVALPLLVSLCVELPDHFLPGILSALRHPAPRLRDFDISRSMQSVPCPAPLPPDLFAHSAPQLHVLAIRTITLPDEPITAFRSVSSLELEYNEVFPNIEIGHHFPNLTGLRLDFFTAVGAPSPQRFNLSGLSLRWIVMDDGDSTAMADAVQRSIDLSAVPVVHVIGADPIKWSESLWKRDNEELSMRLAQWPEDEEDICITVVPGHSQWRRLYRLLVWDMNIPLPIRELPNIRARLAYLRVDAMLLRFFLALELTLTALRDLHIDMRANGLDCYTISPPGYYAVMGLKSFLAREGAPPAPEGSAPPISAPCPALEEITLFAADAPISGVESRRVAFLARALGQLERPRGDKAALALVGVALARPVARTLLSQTVSKIRTYAFAGRGSCEDYDDGLWEDGL